MIEQITGNRTEDKALLYSNIRDRLVKMNVGDMFMIVDNNMKTHKFKKMK